MVTSIFTAIGNAMTSFVGVLGNSFSGVVALFWDGTQLTDVGIILLMAGGVSLVWGAFYFIRGLIRVRTR